mmetsp:Transcript_3648/g.7703  ORF Transcript_3648/g.7703 Transcript_3648/m.7703 type:complete len:148 (+) Transcript_3648:51-494(+)
MPAAVPNLPTLPKYTVLSSTYSTFKDTWAAGKNYRIVSTVESVTETVASKVVSLTSKYTKASTLGELDVIIRPSLVTADVKVSPYIENGITTGLEQKKKLEPAFETAKKVLPVQTALSLAAIFLGIFQKNMERVGKVMLLENPETTP